MKQLSTLIIICLLTLHSNATIITAQVNNAKWSLPSSWSPNRQPANGDTVLIPNAYNLKVDGNENLVNVVIIIRGTLTFTNGKLRLDALSKVVVDFGGSITGGGNNDQISINGVFKYRGTDPPVIGYAVADITTGNGFSLFGVLPFRFVSFTALRLTNGIQLNWTYNYSPSSRYFKIQGSTDGKNWETRSTIVAQDMGQEQQQYSTVLNGIINSPYYRIVQVDYNGSLLYSEVRSVGDGNTISAPDAALKAYMNGNVVVVDYKRTTSEPVIIRLLNTNGQIIGQQKQEGSQLQVSIPVTKDLHGIYIVQVIGSNTKGSSFRFML